MATCQQIISTALRMARIVPLASEPKAKEAEHGLIVLQGIYDDWMGRGMFGRLKDIYTTDDYTAEEGDRIFADGATITLPELMDGDRVPRDLACVSVDDGDLRHYVWDGEWVELTRLALSSECPLSARDPAGLSSLLAIQLAESFGEQCGPATAAKGLRFQAGLMAKANSTQDRTGAEYF
mgnify:CR=1 FL=1